MLIVIRTIKKNHKLVKIMFQIAIFASLIFIVQGASSPKIKPFSFPKSTVAGETVSVTCVLSTITAQTDFKWLKDGVDLAIISQRDRRYQLLPAKGASVLLINSVILEDYGNYTCIVNTPFGSDKYSAPLIIYTPPKWILELFDLSMKQGEVKILDCMATGNPMPTITWLISDTTQDEKSFAHINSNSMIKGMSSLANGSLLIDSEKLNFKDKFAYLQCVADNKIGEPLKKIIKLNLIVPARFIGNNTKFFTQEVLKGASANLQCYAVGDQPLHVQWHRDKQIIDFKSNTKYDYYETKTDKGLNSEILIRTTSRSDGAVYTCAAKNNYGSDEQNIKLLIQEAPEAPSNLRVAESWSRSATVMWSQPYTGNSPLTNYVLLYWNGEKGSGINNRLNEILLDPGKTSYTLKELSPGTVYYVSVMAVNAIGSGQPSSSHKFTTSEETPGAAPVDVEAKASGSSIVKISWKSPPRQYWHGNLTGYYIHYKPSGNSQDYIKTVSANLQNDLIKGYQFSLTGLLRSTYYTISVKAFNTVGQGPSSQELTVQTLEGDAPNQPRVKDYNLYSNTVKITWYPVIDEITMYTIYLKRKNNDFYDNVIPLGHFRTIYTLHGLEKDVDYSIQISATNGFGESELSKPLEVKISTSPFDISFLLTESNLILLVVFTTCLLVVLIAIIASVIYVKKFKKTQQEAIRRLSSLSTLSKSTPKYSDKCGTTRSTATYATIGPPTGHVTIRSAGSNSQSSSGGYGRNMSDLDDTRNYRNTLLDVKLINDD
ncbi:Down syndrome cell adhesion molecule-like protein Dscam2 [Tetranychus urticae]|uniref:SDscam-r1 n=1 Tax=Tetranychus urticae TaxID=32264 RepID=T1JQ47_TETUR|nr:Down syndrome cell adhesion molecule-like protein Dscam2 [Tetranychus urticae]AWV54569.1 sDscam-r1 [Tetranychus urticae]